MGPVLAGFLQLLALIGALALAYVPLGNYMAKVYSSDKHWRVEKWIYRGIGAKAQLLDAPHFLDSYTVKVQCVRYGSLGHNRPLRSCSLSPVSADHIITHGGVSGASGRLALLPCGMVVARSAVAGGFDQDWLRELSPEFTRFATTH